MYWNFVPCLYRSKGTGSSKTAKCAVQVSRKRPNSASTRPISCQLSSAVGMTSVSVIMQELAAQIAATCSEVTHAQKSTVGCIPCVQAVRQLNNPHCADSREVCRWGLGPLAVDTASSNPASGMDVCVDQSRNLATSWPLNQAVLQAWALQQRCNSCLKNVFVSARFQFPFLHIRIVDLDNFWTFYTDCGNLRHNSVNGDCTYALDILAPVILAKMHSYPVIPVAVHSYPVATQLPQYHNSRSHVWPSNSSLENHSWNERPETSVPVRTVGCWKAAFRIPSGLLGYTVGSVLRLQSLELRASYR